MPQGYQRDRLQQLLNQLKRINALARAQRQEQLQGLDGLLSHNKKIRRQAIVDRANELKQESLSWKQIASVLGYTDRHLRRLRRRMQ